MTTKTAHATCTDTDHVTTPDTDADDTTGTPAVVGADGDFACRTCGKAAFYCYRNAQFTHAGDESPCDH